MALASLEDVNRILRYTTGDDPARDAQVRASLAAVEDWIGPSLDGLAEPGAQVAVYFDVYEDATVHLPASDATVTKVNAYFAGGSVTDDDPVPTSLTLGSGYDLDNEGRIMLRPTLLVAPFEGAIASRTPRTYARLEVHYLATGVIPPSVTEGIALLAAGYWQEGPALLQSISHEKIGDYEYWTTTSTSGNSDVPPYAQRALKFLNRHFRRSRVSVT